MPTFLSQSFRTRCMQPPHARSSATRLRSCAGRAPPAPCLVHESGSGALYLLGCADRTPLNALDREELTILHILLHSAEFELLPGSRSRRALRPGAASRAFCESRAPLRVLHVDLLVGRRAGFVDVLLSVLRALGHLALAAKVDAAHAGRRALHGPDG